MKPLRVSSNGRYLVDSEDKPFFYLADTAWCLFVDVDRGGPSRTSTIAGKS